MGLRAAVSASILTALFLFVGCGANAEDQIRNDAAKYADSLRSLANLEAEAGATFKSVIGGNFTDDETLRATLMDQVIPKYQEFLDRLEDINPDTEEIAEIHETFIKGASDHIAGFILIVRSIDEDNMVLMTESNTLVAIARRAMQESLQAVSYYVEGVTPPTQTPLPSSLRKGAWLGWEPL